MFFHWMFADPIDEDERQFSNDEYMSRSEDRSFVSRDLQPPMSTNPMSEEMDRSNHEIEIQQFLIHEDFGDCEETR